MLESGVGSASSRGRKDEVIMVVGPQSPPSTALPANCRQGLMSYDPRQIVLYWHFIEIQFCCDFVDIILL